MGPLTFRQLLTGQNSYALSVRSIFLATALIALQTVATASTVVEAIKITSPPKIDGIIENTEWPDQAKSSGLVDEATNTPSPDGGEFWLMYDQSYIYFSARLQDSNPDAIVADEYRPNVGLGGEDNVSLILDVVGNLSEFNAFSVNPRGANSIRISGGRAAKTEWLGEILTKGRRTETGYEVEARIPWQIMRLPSAGKRDVRFNFERYIPRTQRSYTWRYTNNNNSQNAGTWKGVEIPETDQTKRLQLIGYSLSGADDKKTINNQGLDLRTRLSDQIEGVMTINPEFRTVAQGILGLEFSYFERLADDNRPFFQEGSEFFRTGFGARLFASSRVRSFDVGTKVFGKIDDRSKFGIMNLATPGSENISVVTASHQPGSKLNYDFAYTRLDRKDLHNQGQFVNFGSSKGAYFFYFNAQSTQDSVVGDGNRWTTGFFHNTTTTNSGVDFVSVEKSFRPRLGVSFENDAKGVSTWFEFDKTHPRGSVMETEIGASVESYWRLNGGRYRNGASTWGSVTWRNSLDFDVSYNKSRFEENDDELLNASLEWPRGARTRRWSIGGSVGRLDGQRYRSSGVGVSLRPVRTLNVSVTAQHQRHFEDSRQLIGGVSWDLGNFYGLTSRIVNSDNDWNAYLSLRRSGTRGNEYFLILGDPNARSTRSAITVKAVVPFEIKY